jgi:hypothetical protein
MVFQRDVADAGARYDGSILISTNYEDVLSGGSTALPLLSVRQLGN